jgi:uncharacterized protein
MRILVTGDTHMPRKGTRLPEALVRAMKTADLIIHTGDWQEKEIYEMFRKYGDVIGVFGNTDTEDIRELLQRREEITVNGFKIGIVHGDGEKKTTEKRVLESFDSSFDCIIFGHSHIPYLRYHGQSLLFNPGSPADKRKLPYFSFGIITVEEELKAEHLFFLN